VFLKILNENGFDYPGFHSRITLCSFSISFFWFLSFLFLLLLCIYIFASILVLFVGVDRFDWLSFSIQSRLALIGDGFTVAEFFSLSSPAMGKVGGWAQKFSCFWFLNSWGFLCFFLFFEFWNQLKSSWFSRRVRDGLIENRSVVVRVGYQKSSRALKEAPWLLVSLFESWNDPNSVINGDFSRAD